MNDVDFLIENEFLADGRVFNDHLVLNFDKNEFDVSTNDIVLFSNCDFNGGLEFSNLHNLNIRLEFNNCRFNGRFANKISGFKVYQIVFEKCSLKYFHFLDSEIEEFYFYESIFLNTISLNNIKGYSVSFENKEEKKNINHLTYNCPEVEELEINSIGKIETFKLFSFKKAEIKVDIDKFYVYEGDFEQLIIEVNDFELDKESSKIKEFRIVGVKQIGNINIDQVYFEDFKLYDVDASNGTYQLNEVEIKKSLIDGCIFSKFYCNQITFIDNPEILRSDISNFSVSNLDWKGNKILKNHEYFDNIPWYYNLLPSRIKHDRNEWDIVLLRYQKDTYRQLKIASQTNGNNIDALQFYSNEMNSFWREIRLSGGINKYDRVLIFLNRWSSNFGQSWILPLFWLFIFNGLFYFLIEKPEISYYPKDWLNGFLHIVNYMNPLKSFIHGASEKAQSFDFFWGILNSYLIYHFVRASRKYGRS